MTREEKLAGISGPSWILKMVPWFSRIDLRQILPSFEISCSLAFFTTLWNFLSVDSFFSRSIPAPKQSVRSIGSSSLPFYTSILHGTYKYWTLTVSISSTCSPSTILATFQDYVSNRNQFLSRMDVLEILLPFLNLSPRTSPPNTHSNLRSC